VIAGGLVYARPMTSLDEPSDPSGPGPGASPKKPPKLFECKLCFKVFDAEIAHPACPECDSNDVEQVG